MMFSFAFAVFFLCFCLCFVVTAVDSLSIMTLY